MDIENIHPEDPETQHRSEIVEGTECRITKGLQRTSHTAVKGSDPHIPVNILHALAAVKNTLRIPVSKPKTKPEAQAQDVQIMMLISTRLRFFAPTFWDTKVTQVVAKALCRQLPRPSKLVAAVAPAKLAAP